MIYKNHEIKSFLRILDLKEKTSWSSTFQAGGMKGPQWSADGQYLYFRYKGWLSSFHIGSKKLNKISHALFGEKNDNLKIFFLKINRYVQDKRILPNAKLNFTHFNEIVFINLFCLPYFLTKRVILKIFR